MRTPAVSDSAAHGDHSNSRVDVGALHGVVLVAAQVAEVAVVVDEAAAAARCWRSVSAPTVSVTGVPMTFAAPDDARADAAEIAVEVGDAARTTSAPTPESARYWRISRWPP